MATTETKQPSGAVSHPLPRLLFVCIENSCRSQISEAFARLHGTGVVEAYSTGSKPSGQVAERAILLMHELGYDMIKQGHRSKGIADIKNTAGEPITTFDYVITMGCGDKCPLVHSRVHEDWQIPDPKHQSLEDARTTRSYIEEKIKDLIKRAQQAAS